MREREVYIYKESTSRGPKKSYYRFLCTLLFPHAKDKKSLFDDSLENDKEEEAVKVLLLFVSYLSSRQSAGISHTLIYQDTEMHCCTEKEIAGQTCYLTQSQQVDTGAASPCLDPRTPGAFQGSH